MKLHEYQAKGLLREYGIPVPDGSVASRHEFENSLMPGGQKFLASLLARQATLPFMRDRIEEADRGFFERVAKGYEEICAGEPKRIKVVPSTGSVPEVHQAIWRLVEPILAAFQP